MWARLHTFRTTPVTALRFVPGVPPNGRVFPEQPLAAAPRRSEDRRYPMGLVARCMHWRASRQWHPCGVAMRFLRPRVSILTLSEPRPSLRCAAFQACHPPDECFLSNLLRLRRAGLKTGVTRWEWSQPRWGVSPEATHRSCVVCVCHVAGASRASRHVSSTGVDRRSDVRRDAPYGAEDRRYPGMVLRSMHWRASRPWHPRERACPASFGLPDAAGGRWVNDGGLLLGESGADV